MYELDARLKLVGRPHLTYTHAVAVLGLPGSVQADLLGEAERDRWTTRRLLGEAKVLRAASREPSERARPHPLVQATKRLTKLLEDRAFDAVDPPGAARDEAAERIAEAITRLQQLHASLTGGSPAALAPTPSPAPPAVPEIAAEEEEDAGFEDRADAVVARVDAQLAEFEARFGTADAFLAATAELAWRVRPGERPAPTARGQAEAAAQASTPAAAAQASRSSKSGHHTSTSSGTTK